MKKKSIYYTVITKGDGEFEFFYDEGPCDDCGYNQGIDGKNKARAKEHAKCCAGKVMKVTEEFI